MVRVRVNTRFRVRVKIRFRVRVRVMVRVGAKFKVRVSVKFKVGVGLVGFFVLIFVLGGDSVLNLKDFYNVSNILYLNSLLLSSLLSPFP
jgi:hypothetical protein